MKRRIYMKAKRTFRNIMCLIFSVCLTLSLFGTIPAKAGYDITSSNQVLVIEPAEGESEYAIAGETRHLTAKIRTDYYDGTYRVYYDTEDISTEDLTWSVDVASSTISEKGVVTFSSDITSIKSVRVNASYEVAETGETITGYIQFNVAPEYYLSSTSIKLQDKAVRLPVLRKYSLDSDNYFKSSDAPDTVTLTKVEVKDSNVVTVDITTGLITPVSQTNGDKTTCTAYYTDDTREFTKTFTCTIKKQVTSSDSQIDTTTANVLSEISPNITEDTLYIYSFDDDLGKIVEMFQNYYPKYADLIKFTTLGCGGTTNDYVNGITSAVNSDSAPASLFAVDESMVATFAAKDYVVPLSNIGFKDSWSAKAFDFTKSWGSVNGQLTALAYNACPGLFYYNAEIAEKVFGTSEPDKIQDLVKDWDTFKDTAKKLKAAGYYMLCSSEDTKYAALCSDEALVSDGTFYLGGAITEYMTNAKELYDSGCVSKDSMWSSSWFDDMTNGTVFAYFGTSWFNGSMTASGVEADTYMACEGPTAYNWGGSYISATTACSNKGLAQLFLYTITSDDTFARQLALDKGDYPNNKVVAKQLANENVIEPYTTKNSPYAALYTNAVSLELPEAYAERDNLYIYTDDVTAAFIYGNITFSGALDSLTTQITTAYPDASVSLEEPPAAHKHTIVIDAGVAATCGKAGKTEGTHCSTCNEVIIAQETIPATGKHTLVTDAAVDATCTKEGKTEGTHCTVCNQVITAQKTVAATGKHTYKATTTQATTAKNGVIVKKCSVCGNVGSKTTIYKASTVKLAGTSYTYTGKAIKPKVTVKNSNGKAIASSNYTVTYPSSSKKVGTYTVTVKFKGNYSGTKKLTYTIKPKATKLSSLKAGSKSFTVKWSKLATQTTGYQIQYSTSSKFNKAATKTVKKSSTTSLKVSKLTKGKKYYVRIRTYKTVKVNGKSKNIYSSWSSAKSIKVK
jgi:hypothetical protein